MSLYSETEDPESGEPGGTARPVVFPTFTIPVRLAVVVSWGLVAAATLAVIAALVNAISFRRPVPPSSSVPGVNINQFVPAVGFADRVSLFANGAADLTVALLVVVAVVVTAMAVGQNEARDGRRRRPLALLVTIAAIGSIVVLANIAQAIVILNNVTGQFTATNSANKTSSLLALLPPALAASAALFYAVVRLRNPGEQS